MLEVLRAAAVTCIRVSGFGEEPYCLICNHIAPCIGACGMVNPSEKLDSFPPVMIFLQAGDLVRMHYRHFNCRVDNDV